MGCELLDNQMDELIEIFVVLYYLSITKFQHHCTKWQVFQLANQVLFPRFLAFWSFLKTYYTNRPLKKLILGMDPFRGVVIGVVVQHDSTNDIGIVPIAPPRKLSHWCEGDQCGTTKRVHSRNKFFRGLFVKQVLKSVKCENSSSLSMIMPNGYNY